MNWKPADTANTVRFIQRMIAENNLEDPYSLYFYVTKSDIEEKIGPCSTERAYEYLYSLGLKATEFHASFVKDRPGDRVFYAPESVLRKLEVHLPEWGTGRKLCDPMPVKRGRTR